MGHYERETGYWVPTVVGKCDICGNDICEGDICCVTNDSDDIVCEGCRDELILKWIKKHAKIYHPFDRNGTERVVAKDEDGNDICEYEEYCAFESNGKLKYYIVDLLLEDFEDIFPNVISCFEASVPEYDYSDDYGYYDER